MIAKMDSNEIIAWQVISFFSLDASEQLPLFEETEQWFCKEGKENVGANYLFGCALIGLAHIPSLRDRFYCAIDELDEVWRGLEKMPEREDVKVWSKQGLQHACEWEQLRTLSKNALSAIGLHLNPPAHPFRIEKLIEVQGYRSQKKRR